MPLLKVDSSGYSSLYSIKSPYTLIYIFGIRIVVTAKKRLPLFWNFTKSTKIKVSRFVQFAQKLGKVR